MARSAKGQQEKLEDDDEEHFTENGSSSRKVKIDEANREQRGNSHRSKHSETEQRRRSKINERFQILRDLIPQNDQKRDKASFLLEVIEYIQFLQEKLQMYEQSYQDWNQEPMKLIPWRNHSGPAENMMDPSQAIQNGSGFENNDAVSPSLLTNALNPIESDLSTAIRKACPPDSATETVPLSMQVRLDMFDQVLSSSMPMQHLQDPVSNAESMPCHAQPQVWFGRPNECNCAASDNTFKEHESTIESGSVSTSSAYSQGILNTLTQALQSSGVDLSQASVSVQIDVGRQSTMLAACTSGSKGHENQFVNNQVMACSGVDYCSEDSEQTLKKLRTETS